MHQFRRSLLLTTALVSLALPAHANPDSPNVVGGAATVTGLGTSNVVVNQTTDRAIIDWRTFNIGAGETTRFNQLNSNSVVLNRVTGGLGPSQIFGTLSANGKVFLVNPDGILFGAGSVVNTAGFLATTSNIKNDDFMAGRYIFQQPGRPDASIVNLGTITATDSGFAALVAPGVRNSGTITAEVGSIGLASGNGFTLDFYGDKLITLQVGDQIASQVKDVATGQTLDALVKNTGKLSANGGRVELSAVTARQVVDAVINNTGVIEANTVGLKNGQIILGAQTESTKVAGAPTQRVKVSGTLSASGRDAGTKGGKVKITGENIALNGATIDASGKAGGGKVLVGGDIGGGKGNTLAPQAVLESEAISNATSVTADGLTVINASGLVQGDGGKVVLWSNGATTFYGTILASGAGANAKGGFVETSGKILNVGGATVNAGFGGMWLLDPDDLLIDTALANTISSTLNAGTNVVKETTYGGTGGSGDITVAASINWTTSAMLTLSAYRNIIVNTGASITNTGGGKLVMRADNTGTGTGTVVFNGTGAQVSMSGTGAAVSIYYNPASYSNPTNYSTAVTTPTATDLTAYMLVNKAINLQYIFNNYSGTYALGRDIDMTGITFAPLGNQYTPFVGLLDGQGYTIKNLSLSTTGDPGLFRNIGSAGVVRNLNLTNITVNAGADGQVIGTLAATNNGTISNVTVSGTINGGDFVDLTVGGLVGTNTGTIIGAHANVAISVGDWGVGASQSYVGGLVGTNNTGTIQTSSASGSLRLYSENQTGHVGGFVGANLNGNISDSYTTASVDGIDAARVGGFVGFNSGTISRTYSSGSVMNSGNLYAGRYAGENTGTIVNSYYDSNTSSNIEVGTSYAVASGSSAGVTSFSNAYAYSNATYTGFDFDTTWFMIEGSTRPFLRSEWSTTITNANQLQLMSMDLGASYRISNNIDLGSALGNWSGMWSDAGFVPIGDASNPFTGNLTGAIGIDGQGNPVAATIDGLRIFSSAEAVGMFGVIGAGGWVESVRLTNVNITTSGESQFVGAMAGINRGFIGLVSASGSIGPMGDSAPAASATGAYGGLVGLNETLGLSSYDGEYYAFTGGAIVGSSANVAINVLGPDSGYIDAGGLVGQNRGVILGSWATGNIEASYSSSSRTYLGGLVGWNVADSNATSGNALAGFIGYSYATGSINGYGTGGVGGGLIGVNSGGSVFTSYSTGAVDLTGPSSTVGGLVGQSTGGTAQYAYWDTTTSQLSSSALGIGKTTAELTGGTLPEGFTSPIWASNPSINSGYPYIAVIPGSDTPQNPDPTPTLPDINVPDAPVPDNFTQIVTNLPKGNTTPNNGDPIVIVSGDPAGGPSGNQGGNNGRQRNANRPGDPATTASINGPRIPLDKLPSGVPPINETRFVQNEVTLEEV